MIRTPRANGAVLCLGRLWCDVLFSGLPRLPSLGSEVFAEDVAIAPGGGAFITAAALTERGRKAFLLSRLGLDPLSRALEPELERSGIDLTFLDRSAEAGPQPTIALIHGGERAFVSRRAGAARPSTLTAALDSPLVAHLHIAEFATLNDLPDLIGLAKSRSLTVSLDPSWDDALIHSSEFLRACAGVDVFLPNDAERQAIAGDRDLSAALEHLTTFFPLVIVKRGEAGATLAASDGYRLNLSAPVVTVLDTTGAGDSFNAGFLDSWLAGRPLTDALSDAIEAGSASVRRIGGARAFNRR